MKHLDDAPEPTEAELAEMDEWLAEMDADASDPDYAIESWDDPADPDAESDEERRERIHRNARDMTRIEHDTNWAFISRAGSFLPPKQKPPPARVINPPDDDDDWT